MAVATEIEKELAKHEQHDTEFVARGKGLKPGNPYVFRKFPMMLYRAQRLPGNGKFATAMQHPPAYEFDRDQAWERACAAADHFTKSCQHTVNNEAEYKAAIESGEGWRDTQKDAVAHQEALLKAVSTAAAERNHRDRNMSEGAKSEAAGFEGENFGHQAEIPEAPERAQRKEAAKAKSPAPAA
jgi:hypothetical protein